jgi:hypothetical protein
MDKRPRRRRSIQVLRPDLMVDGLISTSERNQEGWAGRIGITTDLRERFTPFASHIIVSDREILKCIG